MPCQEPLSNEEHLQKVNDDLFENNQYLTRLLCYAAEELERHYFFNKMEPRMADVLDWKKEHAKVDGFHLTSDEELWKKAEDRTKLLKRVHERIITQLTPLELRALHINKDH
jgi:hypothetical protein